MTHVARSHMTLPPREVKPTRYHWTNRELATVRDLYPTGGINACLEALPNRTASSIYQQAGKMRLKRPASGPRQSYTNSEFIDAAIRRAYENPTNDSVKKCAIAVMRPRWWVSKRAAALGLVAPRFRELPWTQAEDAILEAHPHRKAKVLRGALLRAGFRRSETAIDVRRKRIDLSTKDPTHYTANELAKCFGVDPTTITRWIDKGWLIAKRRGTERVDTQGGDMWWITRANVRRFIIENVAAVDIRKVEKHWFVELLTARGEA